MTKGRVIAILVVLVTLFSAGGLRTASAADGTSDAKDPKTKLDIKSVSDSMTKNKVSYAVETYGGWDAVKDFAIMRWYFDTNGDGSYADMCFRLQSVGDGRLRAEFYPKCGGFAWSTSEARKPAPNKVVFSVLIRDLLKGGGVDPGQPLRYKVETEDFNGHLDWVPDNGFVDEAPLPHLSKAELGGAPSSIGSEAGSSSASAPDAGRNAAASGSGGWLRRHFASVGGLPIVTLLLVTMLIVGVGALVWRSVSRRYLGRRRSEQAASPRDADSVHTPDT